MLSSDVIFRYKLALIADAEAGHYLVPGTRAYRRILGKVIPVKLMGPQARATLREFQRRHDLPESGVLDARTRLALIPESVGAKAADLLANWARQGWHEVPPYSNRVPELADIAAHHGLSTWYQQMGWPWCMFAAFLALFISGSKTAREGFHGDWNVLFTVALYDMAQAGQHGAHMIPKSQCKKGTIVLFDFPGGDKVDHVGIVVSTPRLGFMTVATAEGNTSGQGESGSQSDGGKLALRVRHTSEIAAYIEVE